MGKEFTIGSVVRLKSGGPKMTVTSINEDKVTCQWFGDGKNLSQGEFLDKTLERFTPVSLGGLLVF